MSTPAARAGADDGRHGDDVTIGGKGDRRSGLGKPGHLRVGGVPGPTGDARLGQVAGQDLEPGRDTQIGPRQDRRLPHVAQARDAVGLHDFQAVAEIGIGGDKARVRGHGPGVGARRSVLRDQTSSPSENAGGIKASPSVITWFMVYPFASWPEGASRRARQATSVFAS
jgi:hypothetical protein